MLFVIHIIPCCPLPCRFGQIQALSNFDLPIQYKLVEENTPNAESKYFEIDANSGDLFCKKKLDYMFDPHQYRLRVTAKEGPNSNKESSVLVIINLRDINNHAPMFPLVMYVSKDIPEDAPKGTSVMDSKKILKLL